MGTNFYWIPEAIYKDGHIKNLMEHQADMDAIFLEAEPTHSFLYGGFRNMLDKDHLPLGDPKDEDFLHIGKCSGAGHFCKKCHTSLSMSGKDLIHYSDYDYGWYEKCPVCGSTEQVYGCTFTWYDYDRDRFLLEHFKDSKDKVIRDEYNTPFTVEEFLKEIDNVFIWRFNKIQFS